MAITINGLDGNPFSYKDVDASPNNYIYTTHKLTFSGSYSTGGDTLDWTNGGVNPVMPWVPAFTGLSTNTGGVGPLNAFAESNASTGQPSAQGAVGGYYVVLVGTSPSNWKLKIFNAGGTELSAGAYPAAVTNDSVILYAQWRKLL